MASRRPHAEEPPPGIPAVSEGPPAQPSAGPDPLLQLDIVILVIGATGSGMSTFINKYLEAAGCNGRVPLGPPDSVSSFTRNIEHVVVQHIDETGSQNRLVIVDTPGFDNTDAGVTDGCIIDRINGWYDECFPRKGSLGGVIYLYDISKMSTPRQTGLNHLRLLRNKFGDDMPLRKIYLVASKCHLLGAQDSEQVHNEALMTIQRQSWSELIDPPIRAGARVMKWNGNTPESARLVVESVLRRVAQERMDPVLLDVQKNDILILVFGQAKAKRSFIEQYLLTINQHFPADFHRSHSRFKVAPVTAQTPKRKAYPYLPPGSRAILVDAPYCDHNGETPCDHVISPRVTAWLEMSYGKRLKIVGLVYLYVDNSGDHGIGVPHHDLGQLSPQCRDALTINAKLHLEKVPTVDWTDVAGINPAVDPGNWSQVGQGVENIVHAILSQANETAGKYLILEMLRLQKEVSSLPDAQDPGVNLVRMLNTMLKEQKEILKRREMDEMGDEVKSRTTDIRADIRNLEDTLQRLVKR